MSGIGLLFYSKLPGTGSSFDVGSCNLRRGPRTLTKSQHDLHKVELLSWPCLIYECTDETEDSRVVYQSEHGILLRRAGGRGRDGKANLTRWPCGEGPPTTSTSSQHRANCQRPAVRSVIGNGVIPLQWDIGATSRNARRDFASSRSPQPEDAFTMSIHATLMIIRMLLCCR